VVASGDDETRDRVGRAVTRLERAVGRLEELVAARAPEAEAERQRLVAELNQAREDYARLEEVTDRVSGRLDDAIARFRAALGEE